MKRHLLCALTLFLVGILSFSSVALAATVQVTINTDGHGQVSVDGGITWADSVTVDVEAGRTLGDRVQYRANKDYKFSSVICEPAPIIAVTGGGSHALLLDRDGYVYGVGNSTYGQLGNTQPLSYQIIQILITDDSGNLVRFKAIAAGYDFSVLIDNDGYVWTSGANSSGQLGRGNTDNAKSFQKLSIREQDANGVTKDVKFTAAAAGYSFTLLLDESGHVWGAGNNFSGQLGLGSGVKSKNVFTPLKIQSATDVTFQAIAAGDAYSVLLDNEGKVWRCGRNREGQLGNGRTTDVKSFTPLDTINGSTPPKFTQIAAGIIHTILLDKDGKVWASGANDVYQNSGQLGQQNASTEFVQIALPSDIGSIVKICAGLSQSFLLNADGKVWATGANGSGQLGIGSTNNAYAFTSVPTENIGKIQSVFTSAGKFSYIVTENGQVFSAGLNSQGALGRADNFKDSTAANPTFKPVEPFGQTMTLEEMQTQVIQQSVSFKIRAIEKKVIRARYDLNGGTWIGEPVEQDYHDDEPVPEHPKEGDSFKRDGYTFKGWTKVSDDDYGSYELIKYKAEWEERTWTIHFDSDGGIPAQYPDKIMTWSQVILDGVTDPVKRGYQLSTDLWGYLDKTGKLHGINKNTTLGQLLTAVGDTTLTELTVKPIWAANTYTVYCYSDSTNFRLLYIQWNEKILDRMRAALISDPAVAGYTFDGWKYQDTLIDSSTTYADLAGENDSKDLRVELKASFTPKLYTIHFDSNGGSAVADKTGVKWTDVVLAGVIAPSRTDYQFQGWTYEGNPVGEAQTYSQLVANDTVTQITLKADWLDISRPQITGVEDGQTYCAPQTVTIRDNDLDTVTLNGQPIQLDANGQYTILPAAGPQTLVAKDRSGNQAQVTVTINDGHTGGTATCVKKAVCQVCGTEYGDVDPHNHVALRHVQAQAATQTQEGHIEYWYCQACDKYYRDAAATQEITQKDTVLSKLPPKTGDNSRLALWFALLVITGGAFIAILHQKKKQTR